jgi:bifunctional DNA-binding transcriptional regulator/antitoxin component of YhaV-PrlF toxin-antitoxin module
MDTTRFVKSFSKGQITIPKDFRDMFGLSYDFWLKLYVNNNKIIAEPVEKDKDQSEYAKKLLSIKGRWLSKNEINKNRINTEKQIKERSL